MSVAELRINRRVWFETFFHLQKSEWKKRQHVCPISIKRSLLSVCSRTAGTRAEL